MLLFFISSKTSLPTYILPEARARLNVSFFLETSTILKEFFLKISLAQSFSSSWFTIFNLLNYPPVLDKFFVEPVSPSSK